MGLKTQRDKSLIHVEYYGVLRSVSATSRYVESWGEGCMRVGCTRTETRAIRTNTEDREENLGGPSWSRDCDPRKSEGSEARQHPRALRPGGEGEPHQDPGKRRSANSETNQNPEESTDRE